MKDREMSPKDKDDENTFPSPLYFQTSLQTIIMTS